MIGSVVSLGADPCRWDPGQYEGPESVSSGESKMEYRPRGGSRFASVVVGGSRITGDNGKRIQSWAQALIQGQIWV